TQFTATRNLITDDGLGASDGMVTVTVPAANEPLSPSAAFVFATPSTWMPCASPYVAAWNVTVPGSTSVPLIEVAATAEAAAGARIVSVTRYSTRSAGRCLGLLVSVSGALMTGSGFPTERSAPRIRCSLVLENAASCSASVSPAAPANMGCTAAAETAIPASL